MAKTTTKPAPVTSVDVRYDLTALPSAQHKAGLAGLLLHVENMRDRRDAGQLPADVEVPDVLEQSATAAVVRFSERSTRDLFDDLYAAETVEVRSKSKWAGAELKRQEPNHDAGPGEPKQWYFYDTVRPTGHFLRSYTEGDKKSWHKLWCDMIFAVPRNRPTTRQAFNSRAAGLPTKEGADAWKALVATSRARDGGRPATAELSSTLMLAAQSVTAEAVPFEDRPDTQLLLHFWPLTARVFTPVRVDAEGRNEFAGYVLVFPEVSHLGRFCTAYKSWLDHLGTEPFLYRPRDAVIALPEQGGLEFLHNLDRLAAEKVVAGRAARYVAGVEFFHMAVAGQNVKLRAHGRMPVVERLIEDYDAVRRDFRNPEVVSALVLALLRGYPWFAELDATVHERDWPWLVHSTQEGRRGTPAAMAGFAWEVARCFPRVSRPNDAQQTPEEPPMTETEPPHEAVDAIVYEMVRVYVRERACARAGIKPDEENWWNRTAEERRNVCSKLFLELRSRHGDEFVAYFADTLASVVQWLDERQFLAVSRALMRHHATDEGPNRPRTRDDVKTLTMLALAAHSRSLRPREAGPDAPTAGQQQSSAEPAEENQA